MIIILAILVALSWILLLSVKSKKTKDPLIQLREELEFVDLDPRCYELKKAYYELRQAIKNSFKK